MKSKSRSEMVQVGVLFLLYFVTARFGLKMDAINGFATLIWPPTGIAFAAVLLFGARLWPGIFLASLLVNHLAGAPLLAAAGIATGSTLEALIANHLMRRSGFSPKLNRLQDVLVLVIYGAIVSTAFGATFGTLSLWLAGILNETSVRSNWIAWWAGDALGALIVAPLLLVWNCETAKDQADIVHTKAEIAAFLGSLSLICVFLFSEPSSFLTTAPLPLIIFPIVIWTGLRFGVKWSTKTLFVIASAAILATSLHLGPFARESMIEGFALVHVFMGAVAVTSLILVAAVAEHVHARALAKENQERISADECIKSILDAAYDAFISMDRDGVVTDWNPQAESLFGWKRTEAVGQVLADLLVPERFRQAHNTGLRRFLSTGRGPVLGKRVEMSALHRSGKEIPIELTISSVKYGNSYVFNAFLHDISSRKRAQLIQEARLAFTGILTEAETVVEALGRSIEVIASSLDWDYGGAWLLDAKSQILVPGQIWRNHSDDFLDFEKINRGVTFAYGEGIPGTVWKQRDSVWVDDLADIADFPRAQEASRIGLHCAAAFPIVSGSEFVGVLEFLSRTPMKPDDELLSAMADIGSRLGLFVQRKRAEEKSRRADERYRYLIDAVKDYAIIMLDEKGYVASWNSGAQTILGYSAEEVIGKHFSVFYPDSAATSGEPERELQIARETGRYQEESLRVNKSGTRLYVNVTVTPLRDVDGNIYGFSKVTQDITERRRADDNLLKLNDELEKRVEERTIEARKREKQLQLIADALPTIVAEFDAFGRIIFVNAACRKLLAPVTSDPLGKTLEEAMGVKSRTLETYAKTALAGEEAWFEHEFEMNGKKTFFSVSFIPEFNDQNLPLGFIAVATDITRHYEAKESAEAASKAKSAFLANMSHEIRTPLGAVLGFSELMMNQQLSPVERSNYMAAVKRNGELLSNIISDILDISKVEADKMEVERQDIPLVDVLADITTMLSLQAQEKGLALTVTSDGQVPHHISTDPLRLRQILINIVGNAIKFTQRGSVEVKIRLLAYANDTHLIAFAVKDTGAGISPEQAGKLFQAFTQADVSTKRKHGGTGLGLILSKRLANLLGGDVVLTHSEIDKGSTFTITVDPGPVAHQFVSGLLNSSAELHDGSVQRGHAEDELQLQGLKVLLVEDAPDNQVLIGRFLKMAGAQVEIANNGKEAIAKIGADQFDLLLMDLQMPVMDGYEATEMLRKCGYEKPIIALTAHALKEERLRCLASGFNDHIGKPVNRSVLLESIARQCGKASAQ